MRTLVIASLLLAAASAKADEPDASYLGGVGLSVGTGGGDFVSQDLRRLSGASRVWDLRVTFGERNPTAVEAAYIAGERRLEVFGLSSRGLLVTVGMEGTVRVGPTGSGFRPYVFAGLGWTRASLASVPPTVHGETTTDDLVTVPMGAGLAYTRGQLRVDLRAAYTLVSGEDLVLIDDTTAKTLDLDSWTLTLHGGLVFF